MWLPQVDSSIVLDSLKSLLLLLSVLIARTLLVRSISKNAALTMEAKRRWVVSARNTMVFVFLVGLVVIWAHEYKPSPSLSLRWQPRWCWLQRNSFSAGAERHCGSVEKSIR